jgi:hypothetical protein
MDKPWEALSKALVDAVIESLKVDLATCVDFGFWVWNFVSHHWLWLSFRISLACCSGMLLHWWSPFRWTRQFFMRLHVTLWFLDLTFDETESKDTGVVKARAPKPASLRKHQRQKSSRKGFGMVEPVIGEPARR